MADVNKYFTLNNIVDIIEIFEDFLIKNDVRIPESDKEMIQEGYSIDENGENYNSARIYGLTYADLESSLLSYFERLGEKGTVNNVVNSYDGEVETWPDSTEKDEFFLVT